MMKKQVYDRFGNLIELRDGEVLPDGARVRVPMMLFDRDAKRLADEADRRQARADHEVWMKQQQAIADDQTARQAAYDRMCADLDYAPRGGAA